MLETAKKPDRVVSITSLIPINSWILSQMSDGKTNITEED
jgi:hypothetical protein